MRRRGYLRAIVGSAAAGLIAGCTGSDPEAAEASPSDDASRNTATTGGGSDSTADDTSAPVTERWRVQHDGAPGPAVGNGNVFITGAETARSLDASTGKSQWQTPVQSPARLRSAPVEGNGLVYAATARGVVALDAASGVRQWTGGRSARGPLAVAEGRVYATSGNDVIAVDADSGEEGLRVPGGAFAVESDVVYVSEPTTYLNVVAYDPGTGEELWRFENDESFAFNGMTVADGTVYGTTDYGDVFALDAAAGDLNWKTIGVSDNDVKRDLIGPPVVAQDKLLVSGPAGPLFAFDINQGDRQWSLGSRGARVVPAIGNGTVYVSRITRPDSSDSEPNMTAAVQAVDPANGKVQWTYGVGSAIRRKLAAPKVADGTLYHATDSTVVAVKLE